MTRTRLGSDGPRSRAVSDVIAFTIVFSIIITSVGVVSAVGFTTLTDLKVDEQTINAQRAIESLGDNLGEIQRGHAPGRAGEIEVGGSGAAPSTGFDVSGGASSIDGSALFVTREASLNVTVSDASGQAFDENATVGSLRYVLGQKNRTVGIESAATFSRFRDSAVMNDAPRFTCRDDGPNTYAFVSVVVLEADGATGVSGGNVQIEAREVSSELLYANTSGVKNVTVTVQNSNFGDAWVEGLQDENWAGTGGDAVECTGVDSVFVRKTVVEISLG